MNGIVDRLLGLFAASGTRQYGGERVSQCEHALQCAFLAEREGVPETVVTAALLHDIGHLLHEASEHEALRGIDDRHEELGAQHLLGVFGPAVAEPVRLHVAAKRYLCATDPGYFGRLSAPSVRSLLRGGGPSTVMGRRGQAPRVRNAADRALPGNASGRVERVDPAMPIC